MVGVNVISIYFIQGLFTEIDPESKFIDNKTQLKINKKNFLQKKYLQQREVMIDKLYINEQSNKGNYYINKGIKLKRYYQQ